MSLMVASQLETGNTPNNVKKLAPPNNVKKLAPGWMIAYLFVVSFLFSTVPLRRMKLKDHSFNNGDHPRMATILKQVVDDGGT
nr:probable metal-nicotianamine transporter YSL7 [Tanacetum cinerariifolium]